MDEDATTGNSPTVETFDPIHAIFKLVWRRRAEKVGGGSNEDIDVEPAPETSRRNRSTTANVNALKVSCEFLRNFVTEAIQRSAFIVEAEDGTVIEPTHLEQCFATTAFRLLRYPMELPKPSIQACLPRKMKMPGCISGFYG